MESTAGKKLLKQVSLASNQTCQLLQRIAPGANRNHRTHPMVEHATGTVAFFHAMAPVLIANVLTVTELKGEEEGRLTYLWLITSHLGRFRPQELMPTMVGRTLNKSAPCDASVL